MVNYTAPVISEPEDYGLSAAETLAHTADATASMPEGFDEYWARFREAVSALPTRWHGSIDVGGGPNQVVMRSLDSVRIVGQLMMPGEDAKVSGGRSQVSGIGELTDPAHPDTCHLTPETSSPDTCHLTPDTFPVPRGLVITTHGYANVPDAFPSEEPWTERGLATLRVRVRGYPPSTIDVPDLRPGRATAGWIMHKIESPEAWVLRGAVADVITAVRCARAHFPDLPIALHGESLGGGLAVIASAHLAAMANEQTKPQMTQMTQMTQMDSEKRSDDRCGPSARGSSKPPQLFHRLVLSLPSLGDWRWRMGRYCNGAGGEVNVLLDALRGREQEQLLRTLLLFDAALHAPAVDVPCLCKLAERDDVVPAPSAAAIFNALAGPQKWRFVVRYGHFEGGISDLRRHSLFERLHPLFADPAVTCEEAVAGLQAIPAPSEAPHAG